MIKKFAVGTLLVALLIIAALVIGQDHDDTPHWSYEGDAGPAHWGDLSEDFALCGSGSAQSPINIDDALVTEVGLVDISFEYGATALNIFNNGHTIQVNVDAGSRIIYNEIAYNLLQFHFHAPSEHERNGEQLAMEVHFVHRDPNSGNLAVVGILLAVGDAENNAFVDVFTNLPTEEGEPLESDISVDLSALVPADAGFYTYQGSLTTPPCSEIVRWLVSDAVVDLGADQVGAFTSIYEGNARPVLELGNRDLLHDND